MDIVSNNLDNNFESVNDILSLCEISETSPQQYIHNTQWKRAAIDILFGLNPVKHFEPVVKILNTVITFIYLGILIY